MATFQLSSEMSGGTLMEQVSSSHLSSEANIAGLMKYGKHCTASCDFLIAVFQFILHSLTTKMILRNAKNLSWNSEKSWQTLTNLSNSVL